MQVNTQIAAVVLGIVLTVAIFALVAGADPNDPGKQPVAQVDAINKLQEDHANLHGRVQTLEDQQRGVDGQFAGLQQQMDSKVDRAAFDLRSEFLTDVDTRLERLQSEVEEQSERTTRILDDIAKQEGEGYVPNILGNMAVPNFARDFRIVVNEHGIKHESEIYVRNATSVLQRIIVNDDPRPYEISPGERIGPITVPTGNVFTRIEGRQGVNWAVGPPAYRQDLQIVERQGVTVFECPIEVSFSAR